MKKTKMYKNEPVSKISFKNQRIDWFEGKAPD